MVSQKEISKLEHFAKVIDTIYFPEVESPEAKKLLTDIRILTDKTSKYLREQTKKLKK